jgi:hypothetical protein
MILIQVHTFGRFTVKSPRSYPPAVESRVVSPAPRDVWEAVLAESADASIYQTPGWLDCVCAAGGYEDASRLYETAGGRRLVVPMARRRGLPRLLELEASLPARWGYAGILAPDALLPSDVEAVVGDLRERRGLRTSLKPGPRAAAVWRSSAGDGCVGVTHTVHTLDLGAGFDGVWSKRFSSKTRTKVRKAERSGLEVSCDSSGRSVDAFYELYVKSIERWVPGGGRLARRRWAVRNGEPAGKFRAVAERLGDACKIWVASVAGEPAAAIIVLKYGRHAMYWRAAMDKPLAGPTRANYLLQSLAIEDACRAGCELYHMGESSPSIAEFKSAFGAVPEQYVEYRLERWPLTRTSSRVAAAGEHLWGRRPPHSVTAA